MLKLSLVQELEMMKDEKAQYERIMGELTAKFNQMPQDDRVGLQNRLKQEAWEPTQDAIKAGTHQALQMHYTGRALLTA